MGLFGRMKKEWRLFREQARMDWLGAYVKDERELSALKNLVYVARERVWLADEPKKREYSTSFSDALTEDQKATVTESAKVVEILLKRETELRRKHAGK